MNREKLMAQLTIDEDKRKRIYVDTVGKITGGVGRNLTDRDFSDDEIALMLKNDIALCERELDRLMPWWRKLNDARQNVLLNMCFNLGGPRLAGFKKALSAILTERWDDAAREMLNSAWADQVGDRAKRLARIMRTGVLP